MVSRERTRRLTRCTRCERAFTQQDWQALALVETLTYDVIVRHASRWPATDEIEVRACPCGHWVARIAGV